MKGLRNVAFTMAAAVLPALSFAHPGHGIVNDDSALHYLTSSEHFAPAVVLAVLGVAAYFILRGKKATVKK